MIGCHDNSLPELLRLHYSDYDSLHEVSSANEPPRYSHCQQVSPLSAGSCMYSTSLITSSDPTLCAAPSDDTSKQVNVLSACFEATSSADAVTDSFSPIVSVAVDNEPDDVMYRLICSRLQSVDDVDERRRLRASLTVLLQFFETEYLSVHTSCGESLPAFPLHLLEQYTKLIRDDVTFYSANG